MSTSQKVIKYFAIAFGILLSINIISSIAFGIITISGIIIGIDNVSDKEDAPKNDLLISLEEYSDISNLDIDLNTSNLVIKEGQDFKIEISKELEDEIIYGNESNTLILKDSEDVNFYLKKEEKSIILYVPKDYEFETVKIANGIGKCDIEYIKASDLEIKLGVGTSTFENIVSDNVEIKGGVGEVKINNFYFKTLNLETGIGKFSLTGKVLDNAKINSGIGKLDLNLLGSNDEYSIDTKIGIGKISLNNEKCSSNNTYGKGKAKIYVNGGIGEVEIKTSNI